MSKLAKADNGVKYPIQDASKMAVADFNVLNLPR